MALGPMGAAPQEVACVLKSLGNLGRMARGLSIAIKVEKQATKNIQPFIAVVHKGKVIAEGHPGLSHKALVDQKLGGQFPEGARAVTCGSHNDKLEAVNSSYYHGNMQNVPDDILEVLKNHVGF